MRLHVLLRRGRMHDDPDDGSPEPDPELVTTRFSSRAIHVPELTALRYTFSIGRR